jgi:hypothetical protein
MDFFLDIALTANTIRSSHNTKKDVAVLFDLVTWGDTLIF